MRSFFFLFTFLSSLLLTTTSAYSQSKDTLRIMAYNLLNYRNNSISSCSNTNNDPSIKENSLQVIIDEYLPDILVCNEIGTSDPAASFRIAQNVMNQSGRSYYEFTTMQKGQRQINNSSSTGNMIYWDSSKYELYFNDYIEFDPFNRALVRVIDRYSLYYKDPNLAVHGDTIYFHIFIAHLKAGNTTSDRNERDWATDGLMAYLDSNNLEGNVIFAGDFNLYRSTEVAYQNLLNYSRSSLNFYDPINVPGNWSNNSPFAIVHTQSSRTSGSCGATGGMDDRFDFILASDEIMNGTDSVQYITNSYKAIGQDGLHFNAAVNGSPTNTSAPNAVIQALPVVSDHLPVMMDMELRLPSTTSVDRHEPKIELSFNNPVQDRLFIQFESFEGLDRLELLDISGKVILSKRIGSSNQLELDCSYLKSGYYFLKVEGTNDTLFIQKLIKI